MSRPSPLAERLKEVRERIAAAAVKAGRQPSDVTLIAVTKAAAPEQVREILSLGVADLGESRVQVFAQKVGQVQEFFARFRRAESGDATLPPKLRWHMIGHLQRNKVKPILPLMDVIHSVDTLRLAEEIDAQALKLGIKKVKVLMQVNASEEKSKFGVAVGAALHLAEQMDSMPNLAMVGLMTMAPLTSDKEEARFVFGRTRELFEEIRWHKMGGAGFRHLSMGMSNDFEAAIAEGATMVRLGTVLFQNQGAEHEEAGQQ